MQIPFAETHWDSALVLWRQREFWSQRPTGDAAPLLRLEQHLRLHLHVLARCPVTWQREPDDATECLLGFAARFSSPDPACRREGLQKACELLTSGAPFEAGILQALALFPQPADDPALLELYRRQTTLRPQLFELWREQGVQVPAALYHQGELQDRDPQLQRAALAYAADNPQVGLDLFRPYYQPLLGGKPPVRIAAETLQAALWGGLVRGDRDLPRALLRAVELAADPQQQTPLLRLAALSGDPLFLPLLRSHLEVEAESGCELLGLHGSLAALDELLLALERATTMEAAATVWRQTTGQPLGRKPRLSLVGAEQEETGAGSMPDAAPARSWLEQQRKDWKPGERLLLGRMTTPELLFDWADNLAGQGDADRLDLLAIHLRRPLGIRPGNWRAERSVTLARLRPQGQAEAAPPTAKAPRHA